jgi:hypothetical protein
MTPVQEGSSVHMWAGFQAIAGIGAGMLYSGLNFPILAPTPPDLNAPALAFLTFARSYGQVFGVTIGGSVMNNQASRSRCFNSRILWLNSDLSRLTAQEEATCRLWRSIRFRPRSVRRLSSIGIDESTNPIPVLCSAYAAIPVLHTLSEPMKTDVIHAFVVSLRLVWLVAIPLSAVGLLANFFCKEIPMHKHVDEKWGLAEQAKAERDQEMGNVATTPIVPILKASPSAGASVGLAY